MLATEIGNYALPLAAAIVSASAFLLSGLTARRTQETNRLRELESETADLRRQLDECQRFSRQQRIENAELMRRLLHLENGQ